ncbi:MAG: glycerophosphodiester phosphodiesterase [Bdellovibrionales bacterium]
MKFITRKSFVSAIWFVVLQLTVSFAFADQKRDFQETLSHYVPNFRLFSVLRSAPSMSLVRGTDGQDSYEAQIYNPTLRVYEIKKNGQPFYHWDGIKVIGHRSNVFYAPENTLPAMQKAIELGADILELDIRETKDGELVVIHDDKVDRTTNGKGKVKDLTLAQIQALDAGSWFSPQFAGEKVPTLQEALTFINGRALPDIDFKEGSVYRLADILREANLLGKANITFSDSKNRFYVDIKKIDPNFMIRPSGNFGLFTLRSVVNKYRPDIIAASELEISKTFARNVHKRGLKLFVSVVLFRWKEHWRLNRAINITPDYIQGDDLAYLVPKLRSMGLHR